MTFLDFLNDYLRESLVIFESNVAFYQTIMPWVKGIIRRLDRFIDSVAIKSFIVNI